MTWAQRKWVEYSWPSHRGHPAAEKSTVGKSLNLNSIFWQKLLFILSFIGQFIFSLCIQYFTPVIYSHTFSSGSTEFCYYFYCCVILNPFLTCFSPCLTEFNLTTDGWLIKDDKQYYIGKDEVPMEKARDFCRRNFGDLATIHDKEEGKFLWRYVSTLLYEVFEHLNSPSSSTILDHGSIPLLTLPSAPSFCWLLGVKMEPSVSSTLIPWEFTQVWGCVAAQVDQWPIRRLNTVTCTEGKQV